MSKNDDALMGRRNFITLAAGSVAATALMGMAAPGFEAPKIQVKAIAFDAFPIFDPQPVAALVNNLYSEKGAALFNSWRTAQFEYTWLRTAGQKYKNFWDTTEDALVFAAKKHAIDLSKNNRKQLMEVFNHLNTWPDVLPALKSMKEQGLRLCFLSNMTEGMLNSCIRNSNLEGYFDHLLSTDRVRAFKPSPIAYQMGVDALKLKKEEIAFAAFAGWDVAGAKWFGYPTFWVNRQNATMDELNIIPDGSGTDLDSLLRFVGV